MIMFGYDGDVDDVGDKNNGGSDGGMMIIIILQSYNYWIWAILQFDWPSTSRILTHLLQIEKYQDGGSSFLNEKTADYSV